jgi:hypothetical protein
VLSFSIVDQTDNSQYLCPLWLTYFVFPDIAGWGLSPRGAGYLFGADITKAFAYNNAIDLIARAHQLAMDGYKLMFDQTIVTVWSAPNYCYRCVMMTQFHFPFIPLLGARSSSLRNGYTCTYKRNPDSFSPSSIFQGSCTALGDHTPHPPHLFTFPDTLSPFTLTLLARSRILY